MANLYSISFPDDKLDTLSKQEELLPLFHSCDAYWARAIINEKKIKPLFCKVFNEELAYLFYGRPAYKNSNRESSKINSLFPITFIIKSNSICDIKRIAPFDTGAFSNNLYQNFMHSGMRLDNFLLSPNIDNIPKFIAFFFGTNDAYFNGEPKSEIYYDEMDFEIESYFQLIRAAWITKADDRKATVEVQIKQDFCITKHVIEAIVIPSHLASSRFVQDTVIEEWGAEVIKYKSFGVPSDNNYTLLLHLVQEYLIRKGLLDGSK